MILERPQNTNRNHQILKNNCLHQLKLYKCKISNRYHSFFGFIVRDIKYNIKFKKVQNTPQIVYSGCLLRLVVLCVLYCSMHLFLYSPFYHGAFKHNQSSLFTRCFLWIYLLFILQSLLGLVYISFKQ